MGFENFTDPNIQKDTPQITAEIATTEAYELHKPSLAERFKNQFMPVALASFVTFSTLSQTIAAEVEKITDSENGQITKLENDDTFELSKAEQEQIINSVLGEKLAEQYKEAGFSVSVALKTGESGKYLIHIGQTHVSPVEGLSRIMTNDEATKFQLTLLPLLEKTSSKGNGVIFAEGIAYDMQESKEAIVKLNQILLDVEKHDIVFSKLETIFEVVNYYENNRENPLVTNHIDEVLVKKVREKLSNFINNYEAKTEDEEVSISSHKVDLQTQTLNRINSSLKGNENSFNNASLKLYMEDKIKLAPTENEKINNEAVEIIKSLTKAKQGLTELRLKLRKDLLSLVEEINKTKDDSETKKKKEQLGTLLAGIEAKIKESPEAKMVAELEEAFKKVAFDKREKAVLDQIREYEGKNGELENNVVVFGSKHNFLTQLREYDKIDRDETNNRGLIIIQKITEELNKN